MQILFNIFYCTEMDAGCPTAQKDTTRASGLCTFGKCAGGCLHTLNYSIRLTLLKLQML